MNQTHAPLLLRSNEKRLDCPGIMGGSQVQWDPVSLHWMWRETGDRLRVMHTRVREGQDVLAASELARWLRMSGILAMFRDNPRSAPLEVKDGKILKQLDRCRW